MPAHMATVGRCAPCYPRSLQPRVRPKCPRISRTSPRRSTGRWVSTAIRPLLGGAPFLGVVLAGDHLCFVPFAHAARGPIRCARWSGVARHVTAGVAFPHNALLTGGVRRWSSPSTVGLLAQRPSGGGHTPVTGSPCRWHGRVDGRPLRDRRAVALPTGPPLRHAPGSLAGPRGEAIPRRGCRQVVPGSAPRPVRGQGVSRDQIARPERPMDAALTSAGRPP